jgi:hypothetical protein
LPRWPVAHWEPRWRWSSRRAAARPAAAGRAPAATPAARRATDRAAPWARAGSPSGAAGTPPAAGRRHRHRQSAARSHRGHDGQRRQRRAGRRAGHDRHAGRGGTTGAADDGAAGRGGTTGTAGAAAAGRTRRHHRRRGHDGHAADDGTAAPPARRIDGPPAPSRSGAVQRRASASTSEPFGCNFAWGRQNPSGTGSLSSYNYLQMVAYWVENSITSGGTYTTCNGCNWLSSRVNGTNLIPVYYAYMIGFYGHMNGLPDQNQSPSGSNLATGGAALIKANRQKIIDMYKNYAAATYQVWKTKPLIWFLEGDFIQYAEASQGSPLTMAELGQLAADITCAIKSNMPNAVVAINHTTWNANDETSSFWCEMKRADYDLVWTTGVGNNGNFIEANGTAAYYTRPPPPTRTSAR